MWFGFQLLQQICVIQDWGFYSDEDSGNSLHCDAILVDLTASIFMVKCEDVGSKVLQNIGILHITTQHHNPEDQDLKLGIAVNIFVYAKYLKNII
jgi:hypothetical protein